MAAMLLLDSRAVATTFGVIWLVFTMLATAVLATRRKYRGFGRWAFAGPALILALLLLSLRPTAPEWLSMVCANAVLAAAAILYYEGAREFRGLPPPRWVMYVGGVIAIGGLAFFVYIVPSLNARAALMSAFLAVVSSLASITLWKSIPPEHTFGLRLTGSLFALCAATHVARTAYYASGAAANDVLTLSGVSGVFFVAISAELALLPIGFMFLADERVVADLKNAQERVLKADAEAASHRQAETVLRESERQFRTLADAAPVMIWASGLDKGCTYFNRPWLEFTARPIEAELGHGWADGVHPDDTARCLATYNQAFDRRQPFQLEYRLRRYDGKYRWILDSGAPLANPDGVFTGYVGSAIDVTDLRLAREALSSLSGKLIAAQETERAWIAKELHEDLAQRAVALEMQLHNVVQELPWRGTSAPVRLRVQETSTQAADLARDIQAISYRLHSAKLELLGLGEAAAGLCHELSEQYRVSINFSHDGLPENLSRDTALCLFRVLEEALDNAVRHAGAPQVTVALRGRPAELQMHVIDGGVGFDPSRIDGSHGLGLISMKERLNLVGGEIHIESRPGGGTRISVRVPLANRRENTNEHPAFS